MDGARLRILRVARHGAAEWAPFEPETVGMNRYGNKQKLATGGFLKPDFERKVTELASFDVVLMSTSSSQLCPLAGAHTA